MNLLAVFELPNESISYIWQATGCEHTLLPDKDKFAPPSIPTLTIDGFSRWQSIEMLLGPEEHVPYYQFALSNWDLINPLTNKPFPMQIPAESFPLERDAEVDRWHKSCAEQLRKEVNQREKEAYKEAAYKYPISDESHFEGDVERKDRSATKSDLQSDVEGARSDRNRQKRVFSSNRAETTSQRRSAKR